MSQFYLRLYFVLLYLYYNQFADLVSGTKRQISKDVRRRVCDPQCFLYLYNKEGQAPLLETASGFFAVPVFSGR